MSSRRHRKGRIGVSFCILGINKQELFCNKQIGFMKIFFSVLRIEMWEIIGK